jgi:hypothetical protein
MANSQILRPDEQHDNEALNIRKLKCKITFDGLSDKMLWPRDKMLPKVFW